VVHQPPAGEGIAVDVHQAAGGAGVLEAGSVAQRTDLRLAGADRRVRLGRSHEFAHAVRVDFRVVVQQQDVLAARGLDPAVASARIPLVLFEAQDAHTREPLPGLGDAAIARSVVHQYDLGGGIGESAVERLETLNQDLGARRVWDDDADERRRIRHGRRQR
jgi:hypothetical protein